MSFYFLPLVFPTKKMNSTTTQSPQNKDPGRESEYHVILLAVYSVVLLTGAVSLSLMTHILKSSSTSVTSVAVLNLIFAHFLFLVTVPFRIYYYATDNWQLGQGWCRAVSGMIHIHMYMSFIFYVVILITRLTAFYRKGVREEAQFRRIHALLGSAVLWVVAFVLAPCIIYYLYGKPVDGWSPESRDNTTNTTTGCFKFGSNIKTVRPATVFNYAVSGLIIVAAAVLTALQANVLRILHRKYRQGCTSQQEFWAQLKSLFFALIMVVCFVPYHVFRMRYLEDIGHLEAVNEVFLSLTTLNCLDMLTFLGNRTCFMCFSGKGA